MSKKNKKHLISALITFVSAMILSILPMIQSITSENMTRSFVISILLVGVRAGLKALIKKNF